MRTFDKDGRLAVARADRVTLIGRPDQPVTNARIIPGTLVVLFGSDQVAGDLKAWLGENEISAAAKATGIHRSTIDRMRHGLGLASTYDRKSRTTKWRKRREKDVDQS